jgi:hypothetical protein
MHLQHYMVELGLGLIQLGLLQFLIWNYNKQCKFSSVEEKHEISDSDKV